MMDNKTIHERIKNLIDTYAAGKNTVFAAKLGVGEANIRGYVKGVIPKADVLEKIVTSYEINAEWLLTGKGEMIVPALKPVPQACSAPVPEPPPAPDHAAPSPGIEDRLLSLIREKDDVIRARAEEIGALKQTVRQLEREKEEFASVARDSRHAYAG